MIVDKYWSVGSKCTQSNQPQKTQCNVDSNQPKAMQCWQCQQKKKDDQEQQEQKKTKQMHGFKKQRLMAAGENDLPIYILIINQKKKVYVCNPT